MAIIYSAHNLNCEYTLHHYGLLENGDSMQASIYQSRLAHTFKEAGNVRDGDAIYFSSPQVVEADARGTIFPRNTTTTS